MRPRPYLDPATATAVRLIEQRLWLMFGDAPAFGDLIAKGLTSRQRPNAVEKLKLT